MNNLLFEIEMRLSDTDRLLKVVRKIGKAVVERFVKAGSQVSYMDGYSRRRSKSRLRNLHSFLLAARPGCHWIPPPLALGVTAVGMFKVYVVFHKSLIIPLCFQK